MAVTSLHQDYTNNIGKWKKCRDAYMGSDAVKVAGTEYLPQLTGQSTEEYDAYKERALFYNAMGRTVQGLEGAVFRKEPVVEGPDALEPFLADVTLSGTTFPEFALASFREVLITGRSGILVTMPADESESNRPYLVLYQPEQVINWATEMIGEYRELTLAVIRETYEAEKKDEFESEWATQYRVLQLIDGLYTVSIWREVGPNKDEWVPVLVFEPRHRGERLRYIPFEFCAPVGGLEAVAKPPLLDLVEVNLSHYRTSADLEHGRHYTAMPTPWVAGFDIDTNKGLRIGSSTAWIATDPQAKAGILEFTGQGLGALERALEEKEAKMAALGSRLLEKQKLAVEAAESIRLRQAGEQSALQQMAQSMSASLTKVLSWMAEWSGMDPTVTVKLNTDFFEARMTPNELRELVLLWQAGGISWPTLYHQLEQGEITRPGIEAEEERALIDAGLRALPESREADLEADNAGEE